MRRTKDEWTGIVESYKASGLTVRQFCRAENVGEQSLRNWNKRITSRTQSNLDVAHGFVEVRSASATERREATEKPILNPSDQRNGLIIRFRNDIVIEVHPDTDRHTLAWVLALMVNR